MIFTNEQIYHLIKHAPPDIQQQMKRKTLTQGEFLITQGEYSKYIYVVLDGIVRLSVLEANGKELLIGFAGRGESLGEVESVIHKPWLCSVEAFSKTSLCYLHKDVFFDWMSRDKMLNHLIFEQMAFRFYNFSRRASSQLLYPVEYSILKMLYLAQKNNVEMTKVDLANYLGITLRSLNRSLKRLKEKGIALFAGNTLVMQSADKLKQELLRYEYYS